ncbi:MAG: ABC transporter ATP-binding protein [Pseudomonadota bacterium]
MKHPILKTSGLTKVYGGLVANRDITISLHVGSVHAILGPNGAGKSTLINMLSGDAMPTRGDIAYKGQDITDFSADRRSRIGIGRSYQKTNIFREFTVYENCRLAAQSRRPQAFRIFSDADSVATTRHAVERALAMANLEHVATRRAAELSHGAQRQLEIAMVLATNAEVLLLDEPLAGMGADESRKMVELLQKITPQHAILLVEHDMDSVFAVADTITVMVNGAILETGAPDAIRSSPAVQGAYLGEDCEIVI